MLGIDAPEIARAVLPGQFINIRVHEFYQPLLRRPFSVYHVNGDRIEIIFNVVGMGTRVLMGRKHGDSLDIIGPLGCPFDTNGNFETAILVGGGLGVAPLPMLTKMLNGKKKIATLLGSRSKDQNITSHLQNIECATDDGSAGFHGTVVDLLRNKLEKKLQPKPKIFGCGPNPMLRALSELAAEFSVPCEVSLESAMACGIGICQGCPIERSHDEISHKKYGLICKEGPVFDSSTIQLP
ncbi:MAG TPA: dihydroorotate dehydrogenase electron transfer subunit [Bacteroidota bacterium]|nr:dihydroorotate dehydrogenase electron transfer subunit [Bacteroidota bacterium]